MSIDLIELWIARHSVAGCCCTTRHNAEIDHSDRSVINHSVKKLKHLIAAADHLFWRVYNICCCFWPKLHFPTTLGMPTTGPTWKDYWNCLLPASAATGCCYCPAIPRPQVPPKPTPVVMSVSPMTPTTRSSSGHTPLRYTRPLPSLCCHLLRIATSLLNIL